MASIVLTNNAKFTPYSFEDMLKPLAMATQEYNAIEEGIAELGTKADLMRMYANEEPNSEWAKKYNEYANDLDKQAESLAKHGLNPASRQSLLNLKRAYSSSVSPIEEAAKARKEAYKYRDTIRAKDNTAMFKNSTLSLSDFMNGKEGDNTYISGKDIMARVASKAQIEGTNMFNKLLEQKYTSEAALQAVDNWSRSADNPIIAEELKAIGYENYSPEDQAKIMNSIGTGMYNAASEIAKGEYMNKKERESLDLQKASYQRQLSKLDLEMAEAGYMKTSDNRYVPDPKSPVWLKDNNGNIIGKASKTSNASSKTDNSKVIGYKDTVVYTRDGGKTKGLKDGDKIRGERVDITAEGDSYVVSVQGIKLGSYNTETHEYTSSVKNIKGQTAIEALNKALGGSSYDADYDDDTLKRLLMDAADLVNRSSPGALSTHHFYFDPDNASSSNESGGYTIDPLYRSSKSTKDKEEEFSEHNIQ